MPTIERVSDDPYEWRIGKARLEDVANVEKTMPNDFVSEDGFGISEAARTYLNPLIAGEDYPAYHQGLPRWAVLKRISVARKLASRAP